MQQKLGLAGSDAASLDVDLLLGHALQLTRAELWARTDQPARSRTATFD